MENMSRIGAMSVPARAEILKTLRRYHVILTASVCLFALVAVMKNVLGLPPEILGRDTMVYIIIYFGFLLMAFPNDDTAETAGAMRVFWDVLVVVITLAILVVYAL